MPVNQGGSALKGIYLGDQLLTGGGGGNAQESLPGGKTILFGDLGSGYMGTVAPAEFGTFADDTAFSGNALAAQVGITAGKAINSDTDWLKFANGNEVIYIPQKPIRYSISWQKLAEADCVFGRKVIQIGEAKYRMTLLGGLSHELSASDDTVDSEWDRLLPLTNLSPTQLGLRGNGEWSWCKETTNNISNDRIGLNRSLRGGSSVAGVNYTSASTVDTSCGWRPALRFTL